MKIVNSTALISNNLPQAEHEKNCPERSDAASQTALTFPSKLPKEVEELLKKYHFFEEDEANESQDKNGSMMDISTLRRKLFIQKPESPEPEDYADDESFGVHLSPPPRTPELTIGCDDNAVNRANPKSNDSFGSDMFGELSPIRKCSSPQINSNDISMMSDCGQEKTPSRGFISRKKGKNLSESFCLLQHEFDDNENGFAEKDTTIVKEPKRFARFDSGFPADEDSKLSAENMQF